MTQPQQTTLARKWRYDVNTGTTAAPVWTQIRGIAEATPQPGEANLEDDNTYDEDGYQGKTKTGLATRHELKLARRLVDPSDVTVYDPGQEKLRACALAFGGSGVAQVRWYDRDGGPEAYMAFFEVGWGADGGSMTDLETVTVTLEGKGAPDEITNPNATPTPVPLVLAVSPATGPAAGGTLTKITGQYFTSVTGAAGVKFGGTNATSYFVEDDNTIYAVTPAHAAGTVQTLVTNTTGGSADTAADNFVYV